MKTYLIEFRQKTASGEQSITVDADSYTTTSGTKLIIFSKTELHLKHVVAILPLDNVAYIIPHKDNSEDEPSSSGSSPVAISGEIVSAAIEELATSGLDLKLGLLAERISLNLGYPCSSAQVGHVVRNKLNLETYLRAGYTYIRLPEQP